MIIKFLKAFVKASNKERREFFRYIFKRTKERFINYWFGYVSVYKQYIRDLDGKEKLHTFSIIVGKHGKGQWFSELDASKIQTLIDSIKSKNNKCFWLHLNLGCGAYQEYLFDKYQTKLLLQQLEKIVNEEEIYIE